MCAKKSIPPRLARKLLLSFLREDLAEEVLGDLEQKFYTTRNTKSHVRATLNYWYQVMQYIRPFAIKKSKSAPSNHHAMINSYFKITIRNLLKQKLYSVINIGGLSVGLGCFIMIMLYVQHEFSYDRFFENSDRIYRVYQRQLGNEYLVSDYFAVTPAQLASVLREEFQEVDFATTMEEQHALIGVDDKNFYEKGLAGDYQFFDVFTYEFLKGNPKEALKDPRSIVLTRSFAEKVFGGTDPVGQFIKYQNGDAYTVTGILEDPPSNSSFQFSFVVNILSNKWYAEEIKRPTWNGNSFHTFFLLTGGSSPENLVKKFPALLRKYRDTEAYANYPFKDEYFIQTLPAAHMQQAVNMDIGIKGSRQYIYLFSVVALIVLLLACVNYMNLAIARSIKRAREVGLRKVVGAIRGQLITQFLGESILIAFLSLVFAIGLTYLILPAFGRLMERPIEFNILENQLLVPGLFILMISAGVLSGSYPAFVMSSLRPVQALKGNSDRTLSPFRLQRWLIVGQYGVAIVLIISSLVIYNQLQYMQQKESGVDRANVVVVPTWGNSLTKDFENIQTELQQHPRVIATTMSSSLPINITSSHIINDEPGGTKDDDLAIYRCSITYDFLQVFGIKLVAGRDFAREINADATDHYLINETAAKALGWTPQEAVGKQVMDERPKTIIGVVKDFHMHSMHLAIQPLLLKLQSDWANYISIKVQDKNLLETISLIERTLKKYSPYPFQYKFLDDHFDELYKNETKLGEIFGFFTLISILIASLGLFGLAAFTAQQRTKEIGVRKVLGASVQSVVLLLSKDFLILVGIAFVLSIPIAWYTMHEWLQSFAYRVNIGWVLFATAGVFALVIANLAIGYQSVRAATSNPVDSLRSE